MPTPGKPPEVKGFVPAPHCPTLTSSELTCLINYMRCSPDQRRAMLKEIAANPATSGSLIHAMSWLFTV